MKRYLYYILVGGVFVLACFLRFNHLSSIPAGLEQDETSIGYNAYSIITTGKDEYGKPFPVYFKAFGEYKLPGYIYATVLPVQMFGLNAFSIRFMSALSGSLTVVLLYFLLQAAFKGERKGLPILAAGLLAINPWHLQLSRGAFEVTLALFFIVAGVFVWMKAQQTQQKALYFFSVLLFILALYTYNIAKVLSLLFICFFILQEAKYFLKHKKLLIGLIGFIILLLAPFFTSLSSSAGIASAKGTLFYSSAVVQAPLIELREYYATLPSLFAKLFFNLLFLNIWQYLSNIASYFSVSFFFVIGSAHGNHGIGNVGLFYLFELPMILLGIMTTWKLSAPLKKLLLFWIVSTILIASLTRDIPQATRSFFMVVPLEVLSAIGIITITTWIYRQKMVIQSIGLSLLFCLILFNLVYYFTSYYVRFPILYAKDWKSEDQALSLYLKGHQQDYSHIIFDTHAGFVYTSLLFYTAYSPQQFQQTVKRATDDSEGFSQVLSFGKYEFKDVDFSKDYQKGTLIITTTDRKPENLPPLVSFAYPSRPVAFAVGQEIISYPVQDFAYVALTKK